MASGYTHEALKMDLLSDLGVHLAPDFVTSVEEEDFLPVKQSLFGLHVESVFEGSQVCSQCSIFLTLRLG